jgi:hypothetical protein
MANKCFDKKKLDSDKQKKFYYYMSFQNLDFSDIKVIFLNNVNIESLKCKIMYEIYIEPSRLLIKTINQLQSKQKYFLNLYFQNYFDFNFFFQIGLSNSLEPLSLCYNPKNLITSLSGIPCRFHHSINENASIELKELWILNLLSYINSYHNLKLS